MDRTQITVLAISAGFLGLLVSGQLGRIGRGETPGQTEAVSENGSFEPSKEEGFKAVLAITEGHGRIFGVDSAPRDCKAGTIGSEEVRVCTVCAVTVLEAPGMRPNQFIARRADYTVRFKRALSFDQPDVTPADGSGVWVAMNQPRSGFPRDDAVVLREAALTTDHWRYLNVSMYRNYLVYEYYSNGGEIEDPDQLVELLGSDTAKTVIKATVGSCDGTIVAGSPLPPNPPDAPIPPQLRERSSLEAEASSNAM